jgi:hypothetical protein
MSGFMELILNLLWLACAVALSVLLARRLRHAGGRTAGGLARWQSIVLLACALAILFPVISMTDDLFEMQCLVEESPVRGGARVRASRAVDAQLGGPELWLAAFEPARRRAPSGMIAGGVEIFQALFAPLRASQPSISRAPPLLPA